MGVPHKRGKNTFDVCYWTKPTAESAMMSCGWVNVSKPQITVPQYLICQTPWALGNTVSTSVLIQLLQNLKELCSLPIHSSVARLYSPVWSHDQVLSITVSRVRHLQGTDQHKQRMNAQTSMPQVGSEHMTPVFKRTTIVNVSDRAATVIGFVHLSKYNYATEWSRIGGSRHAACMGARKKFIGNFNQRV
jgi:hypothetical protein